MKWDVSFETKCQGMDLGILDQYHAISFPIYQTATFSRSYLGEMSGFDYTRQTNPTRSQLESVAAGLENAKYAISFSSGMAAVTAVMDLFESGNHILIDEDLYGGSVRLFDNVCKKNGLKFSTVDCRNMTKDLLTSDTRAIYVETPTNPMMHIMDIRELAKFSKKHGILLIVDNTFLSPYLQNPLDLGADLVIHSGTKFLAGHHDTIGGIVMTNSSQLEQKLRLWVTTTGACLSPFDSWLMLRGIRTLALRVERATQNAMKIAQFLNGHKKVSKVMYPGLPSHPGHEIMKRQARGYGALISFEADSKETAVKLLNNAKLFYFAESLGGTETLITYPLTQTHAAVPKELREKNGINERLLRLSVGIEGADDLIDELDRLLKL